MFDDQPIGNSASQIPGNLPVVEPQDMFENIETPSALDAGILKPKPVSIAPSPLGMRSTPPNAVDQPLLQSENAIKGPTTSRGIMVVILSVVIGVAVLGTGWYVYKIFTKTDTPIVPSVTNIPVPPLVDKQESALKEEPIPALESDIVSSSEDSIDQEILVGETPDTDGDGLKDIREKELGTDPNNWDTDKDDLSDGEEAFIWHTDPLKMDTDGDTFTDSKEIRAGYSPTGPGRIGELQNNASSTSVSSSVKSEISSSSSSTVPIVPAAPMIVPTF